jgi:hypothetical protein
MRGPTGIRAVSTTELMVVAMLAIVSLASCGGGSNDVAGPEYTIQVVRNGNGSGAVADNLSGIRCPDVCGPLDYTPNMAVTLIATPDQGSSFGGWSGDCTPQIGEPTQCDLVVTGHMVVTATFNSP